MGDKISISIVITNCLKIVVPSVLCVLSLIFATTKGITRRQVLPWIEECHVRLMINKIRTSTWLATVKGVTSDLDRGVFELLIN